MADALDRLPHKGAMSLIAAVTSIDTKHIVARAMPHGEPDYPLRINGILYSTALVELGAQAAAVHALLRRDDVAGAGLLLSLANVKVYVMEVEADGPLTIRGEALQAVDRAANYHFTVYDSSEPIIEGDLLLSMEGSPE